MINWANLIFNLISIYLNSNLLVEYEALIIFLYDIMKCWNLSLVHLKSMSGDNV